MKKYFVITTIAVVGILVGVSVLAATSIILTPTTVSVKAGQTFSVPVSVNPQGVKNYAVGLKLNYPADLLQVQSFTFGSQWMALNQPGYDLVDNTNGVLIKTAGYPQGFTSNTQFGTAIFLAKKTGAGVITLANGTMVLDQSNQNLFAGSSQVNVSVTTPASTVTPVATITPTSSINQSSPTLSPTSTVDELTESETESSDQTSAQQATILGAIGNVLNLGTGNWLVALIVVLAIAYGAYWLIKRKLKK